MLWVHLELKITLPIAENNTFRINNNKDKPLWWPPCHFLLCPSFLQSFENQTQDSSNSQLRQDNKRKTAFSALEDLLLLWYLWWSHCGFCVQPSVWQSFKEPHLCQFLSFFFFWLKKSFSVETLRTTITANNLPLIPYVTENTIIKVCFLKNCLNSAYFFKLAIKKKRLLLLLNNLDSSPENSNWMKKANTKKGYLLYDSIHITFWNDEILEMEDTLVVARDRVQRTRGRWVWNRRQQEGALRCRNYSVSWPWWRRREPTQVVKLYIT